MWMQLNAMYNNLGESNNWKTKKILFGKVFSLVLFKVIPFIANCLLWFYMRLPSLSLSLSLSLWIRHFTIPDTHIFPIFFIYIKKRGSIILNSPSCMYLFLFFYTEKEKYYLSLLKKKTTKNSLNIFCRSYIVNVFF